MLMRRNRRRRRAHVSVLHIPFAGIVVLVCAVGLLYVWLGCRCEFLGQDIKDLEVQIIELKEKGITEECKWARMKSPVSIEQALKRHNLSMTWPRPNQVVRLSVSDDDVHQELADGSGSTLRYAKVARYGLNE